MIHPLACVGSPPEWRGFEGPGIKPVISPSAHLSAFVTVDAGTECATYVGPDTLLFAHVHVGHDARIGSGCQLAPGCSVGGFAEIGPNCKLGMNVCVKPRVKIGANNHIGMGAVVTKDIPDAPSEGYVVPWVGNPAHPMERTDDGLVHLPAFIADNFGTSRSEARRLIAQGGVALNGRVLTEVDMDLDSSLEGELQVGRRRTVRFPEGA